MFYFAICASVLAGVFVVLTRIINANLAKIIGVFESTFFNYIVGLFFSLVFFFFSKESIKILEVAWLAIPLWVYLGGLLGVMVIVLSSYLTPKISSFYLTLLIFIGQLSAGMIIDYFSLNELSTGKFIGGIFVLIGLTYNLIVDEKKTTQTESSF